MGTLLVLAGLAIGGYLAVKLNAARGEDASRGAEKIRCPHCGEVGHVTGSSQVRAKGISGGKAAGAVATGGLSVFALGLSKNERVRQLECSNCNSRWDTVA